MSASRDVGDLRAWVIDDTTPRTTDRRVERGGRERRQHGELMAAGSTTVAAAHDDQRTHATVRTPREVADG
jgi:hypothetical protein